MKKVLYNSDKELFEYLKKEKFNGILLYNNNVIFWIISYKYVVTISKGYLEINERDPMGVKKYEGNLLGGTYYEHEIYSCSKREKIIEILKNINDEKCELVNLTYTNYSNLFEATDLEKISYYFKDFLLNNKINDDSDKTLYNLNKLYELVDYYNYYECITEEKDVLDNDIKLQLTTYLKGCLDYENKEIMDIILSIIVNLYLKEVYLEIVSNKKNIKNKKVLKLIRETFKYEKEFRKDIITNVMGNVFNCCVIQLICFGVASKGLLAKLLSIIIASCWMFIVYHLYSLYDWHKNNKKHNKEKANKKKLTCSCSKELDFMNSEQLIYQFKDFLQTVEKKNNPEEIIYNLEELYELAICYMDYVYPTGDKDILDNDVKLQLETYLRNCLDYENEDIMDIMLSIVVNLPLKELYLEIVSNKDNIKNKKVIKMIEETIEEENTIENTKENKN